MQLENLVVTIDGPAASGKGTLARAMARLLGLYHLDSGLLYRKLAMRALADRVDPENAKAVAAWLSDLDIRDFLPKATQGENALCLRAEETGKTAALLARYPDLRVFADALQRHIAQAQTKTCAGVVVDGRDSGSVVFVDAPVKLFVRAPLEVRAQRRYRELKTKRPGVTLAFFLRELEQRDRLDLERRAAPLCPSADAYCLDTQDKTPAMVLDEAMDFFTQRLKDLGQGSYSADACHLQRPPL